MPNRLTSLSAALALGACLATAVPAAAQTASAPPTNQSQFLGIDLDNGAVFYNGRNSGRYCLYRTVEGYNTRTGYAEQRRVRRCGRGLYL